jgi:phosphatidylserine synthase
MLCVVMLGVAFLLLSRVPVPNSRRVKIYTESKLIFSGWHQKANVCQIVFQNFYKYFLLFLQLLLNYDKLASSFC